MILGNVLCEIPDVDENLKILNRMLKPGGRIYFQEHVKQEGIMGILQELINPFWVLASDGCNCNRHTLKAFDRIGWKYQSWTFKGKCKVALIDHMEVGVAVKR